MERLDYDGCKLKPHDELSVKEVSVKQMEFILGTRFLEVNNEKKSE